MIVAQELLLILGLLASNNDGVGGGETSSAYSCILDIRAVDDQADDAIRKVNEEIAHLHEAPSSTESTNELAAAQSLRTGILERQHDALNEARKRCDLRRQATARPDEHAPRPR